MDHERVIPVFLAASGLHLAEELALGDVVIGTRVGHPDAR